MKILKIAGASCLALLFVSTVAVAYSMLKGPEFASHLSREECRLNFPQEASDICYMMPSAFWPNTAFEFDIDEASFIMWAEKNEWPVKEISGKPFEIIRYAYFMKSSSEPGSASVASGLGYSYTKEDTGIYVAYDRAAKRAYYMSHTR
ncbi:MAG: hypothetical protein JXR97_15860 [Planctomycetes bacterium]|nr:hypothetical protein [Planctomycetota bacterium]